MVVSAAVLLLAVVVIGLGASVELSRAVRARRAPAAPSQGAAVQAVLEELDARPFLLWFGIAALAVLAPGLLDVDADQRRAGSCRGGPGPGRRARPVPGAAASHGTGRAGWRAVAGAVTVLSGLAVGFS